MTYGKGSTLKCNKAGGQMKINSKKSQKNKIEKIVKAWQL